MRKFYWVLLIILLFTIFTNCAVNTEKTRTMKGTLRNIIGSFELFHKNPSIKGKFLTWKNPEYAIRWWEEATNLPFWPVYPAEKISKEMIGCKLEITYQVSELIGGYFDEGVPLVFIKEVKILKKKKEKT